MTLHASFEGAAAIAGMDARPSAGIVHAARNAVDQALVEASTAGVPISSNAMIAGMSVAGQQAADVQQKYAALTIESFDQKALMRLG